MSEDLEMRARLLAGVLKEQASRQAHSLTMTYGYRGGGEIRDHLADTLAELAEIVRLLVAEVSSQ